MAPSSVNPVVQNTTKRIPTAQEVDMAGGVWAPTSAKRDKLTELKSALSEGQSTLDDVATPEEKLDLYLADGVRLLTKVTDVGSLTSNNASQELVVIREFVSWLEHQYDSSLSTDSSSRTSQEVNQTELEARLQIVSAKLSNLLEKIPSERCLRHVRDFLDPDTLDENELNQFLSSNHHDKNLDEDDRPFNDSVSRLRLLLTKAAVLKLQSSWDILTKISDSDIDRAAVQGIAIGRKVETVSLPKIYQFLTAHASGTCSERFSAAWNLLDRDDDGLLNEDEMNQVAVLCLGVQQEGLPKFFEEVLAAHPVRAPLLGITSNDDDDCLSPTPQGWRQRRREKRIKGQLLKMFQRSCKNAFRDEVEINHRLRCIYAWADKADQDNKIKSVLVDSIDGWSGRKRYVELSPKLSEDEFREVQSIHFQHLDQIGTEIVKSFREDLWIAQGKGRERKELVRDSLLFLTVVTALDFVILSL